MTVSGFTSTDQSANSPRHSQWGRGTHRRGHPSIESGIRALFIRPPVGKITKSLCKQQRLSTVETPLSATQVTRSFLFRASAALQNDKSALVERSAGDLSTVGEPQTYLLEMHSRCDSRSNADMTLSGLTPSCFYHLLIRSFNMLSILIIFTRVAQTAPKCQRRSANADAH